jgi:hypothetical protein
MKFAAITISAALGLLGFSPAPSWAGGPGSAGLQVLKSDLSPRAMGMGGAFAAVADDSLSASYNPAGLGQIYVPEAAALYLSGFEDNTLSNFSYVMPLPLRGLAGLSAPAVGIGVLMADAGNFTLRTIGPGGAVTEAGYDAQKDLAVSFSYGEKVAQETMKAGKTELQVSHYLGGTAKYLRSTMLGEYTATGFAFDFGWLAMEPNLGLTAAVSLSNFGAGLKYISETTPLPSILRVGASWQRPTVMDQSLLLGAELDSYTAESGRSLRLGAEYRFERLFSLRLGYRGMDDNPSFTIGFGVRFEDAALDFATTAAGEVYNTSQVSFSYKFSGLKVKRPEKKTIFKDPEPVRKAPPAAAPPKGKAPAAGQKPRQQKKNDSDFFWLY